MTQEDKGREGVVARMEALVRHMASVDPEISSAALNNLSYVEARAIVALLPAEVDPASVFIDQAFSGISDGGPIRDDAVKSLMREAFDAGQEFAKRGMQS